MWLLTGLRAPEQELQYTFCICEWDRDMRDALLHKKNGEGAVFLGKR